MTPDSDYLDDNPEAKNDYKNGNWEMRVRQEIKEMLEKEEKIE